jgi:hypothetical protein
MKNIVRCFAIALAVTGIVATTSANGLTAKTTVSATKTSAHPIPVCDPGSGDCGMGTW